MDTITLDGRTVTLIHPDASTARDLWLASLDNPRRAHLAALGVACPDLLKALPTAEAARFRLGVPGFRALKGNVFDFAAGVEAALEAARIPLQSYSRAAYEAWVSVAARVLPGEGEVTARADFSQAGEAERPGTPSSSA